MSDNDLGQNLLYMFANSISPISHEEWLPIKNCFTHRELKKDQIFQEINCPSQKIAFVVKGVFCISNDSEKFNIKSFVFENQLIGAYRSLLASESSNVEITALEDSIIYEADYQLIQELMKSDNLLKMNRKIMESEYIKSEKRIFSLCKRSAAQRLEDFRQEYPNDWHRVSKKLIAAYLCIEQSTLSRLLSKK